MLEIEFRPRALRDIDGIAAHIILELKSPRAARKCISAIQNAIEQAARMPQIGHEFIDDGLERTYRRILAKNYWVYYSHDTRVLTVHRVFHVTQDVDCYAYEMLVD